MRSARRFLPLAVAVALVAPALVFADAEADLDKAIAKKDNAGAKSALVAATSSGDSKAANTILKYALKLQLLDCHAELVSAIEGVKEEAGLKKLAESCRHDPSNDMRYVLVEGLAMQGGSGEGAKAVLDALDSDKADQVLVIAARNARRLDPQLSVDRLIARLEKAEKNPKESTLSREITGSLCSISGEDLTFAMEWKGWWHDHKDSWKGKGDSAPASAPAGNAGGDNTPAGDTPKKGKRSNGGDNAGGSEGNSGGGDTVTGRLARERPSDARTIERLADDDVICVQGGSDKVEEVLSAIKVKHKVVKKDKFSELKLDPKSVLVVNCDGKGHPLFGDEDIAKIREFVEKGGYLFTSDWELKNTIERAFPGSIAFGGKSSETFPGPGYKVDIFPAREASGHPFLRDVFPLTTWDAGNDELDTWTSCLPDQDRIARREDPARERRAQEALPRVSGGRGHLQLGERQGREAEARHGDGRAAGGAPAPKTRAPGGCVLHVLSHFKHQKDKDSGDHFALQQLLLNFFLEKQAAKHGL